MLPIAVWFHFIKKTYNPLINYKWDTFVDNGVMKLKDSGSKPKYDSEMNSGKGIKTDTSGTEIDLSSVTDAISMIYMIDGVATYTETLFYLFNTDNVYKDLYYFSDALTQQEIDKYSSNPNGFFQDVQDGIIDNCVLNMPMDGTDEFVRDYANYSEGLDINTDGDVSFVSDTNNTTYSTDSDIFDLNTMYIIEFTISNYTEGAVFIREPDITAVYSGNGTNKCILSIGDTLSNSLIYRSSGDSTTLDITTNYIKKITGIHEISNYTTSVRDTTSTLNYGSQELNFLRNGLWRGDISTYLQMNGSAQTGYTPSGTFQIEEVTRTDTVTTHRVYSSDDSKFTNGVSDGTFTVPSVPIILSSTNIENIAIDEYRLFKVHTEPQDPQDLYNKAVDAGLLN